MIRDFLMEYCDKPFVSGFEQMTPRLLPGYFAPYSDTYENDRRGSYIFCSKGSASRSIMLEAHVDELGFMITELLPGGFLRFSPVGYYNTLCLEAQDIIIYGKKEVAGVICARPDKPQPEKEIINLRTDWLYIDTGLSDGELEALVQPGDVALNVMINAAGLKDTDKAKALKGEAQALAAEADSREQTLISEIEERL